MYKAIIFDFFDVIAPDFYRLWLENIGRKREGEFLTIAQAIDRGKIGEHEYYTRLGQLSGQASDSIRNEFENKTQLNQDVLQLINNLKQSYKIGLLTNSPAFVMRRIIQNNHLGHYFDIIVISGEAGLVKPDPKLFKLTLDQLGVNESETIFIDDVENYTKSARAMGITSIQFSSNSQLKTELLKLGIA